MGLKPAEWVEVDDAVTAYVPSCETDLAFVKSMLQSADIPFSVAGEEAGVHYGGPQLYVARKDADNARELLTELRKKDQEEWADPEDREEPEVPSFSPPPLEQPPEPEDGLELSGFSRHVLRLILSIVIFFLAIAALMFLASKLGG